MKHNKTGFSITISSFLICFLTITAFLTAHSPFCSLAAEASVLQTDETTTDSQTGAETVSANSALNASTFEQVQYLLYDNGIDWEASCNVSGERLDLICDHGNTTLVFLSHTDESGNLTEPLLVMGNTLFDHKTFEEYFMRQPDDPTAEYYPQTAERLLTNEELSAMNQTKLSVARNEIYARHGRKFSDPFLNAVFTSKDWYQPLYDESQFEEKASGLLNQFEHQNLAAITKNETEREFRIPSGENVVILKRLVSGSWVNFDGSDAAKKEFNYVLTPTTAGPQFDGYELEVNMHYPDHGFIDGRLVNTDPVIYTASLDGATTQLFVCGDSLDGTPVIDVYTYTGSILNYAGSMKNVNSAGRAVEFSKDGSCLYPYSPGSSSQASYNPLKYIFKDGALMPAPYKEFLLGNLEVDNPFNKECPLSTHLEEQYGAEEFRGLQKYFTLIDLNGDGCDELCFKMTADGPDEILLILSLDGDTLKVYDCFESHSIHTAFTLYDDGIVGWGQNDSGDEEILYRYDKDGRQTELIHFISSDAWVNSWQKNAKDMDSYYYEYYYWDGDDKKPVKLNSLQEYNSIRSQCTDGKEAVWHNLADFTD